MNYEEVHNFKIEFTQEEFNLFMLILEAARAEDLTALKHLKRDIVQIQESCK